MYLRWNDQQQIQYQFFLQVNVFYWSMTWNVAASPSKKTPKNKQTNKQINKQTKKPKRYVLIIIAENLLVKLVKI